MKLKVGTRRSNLALTQTRQTMDELVRRRPEVSWEAVEITTMGDRIQDRPLREAGGKGLFLKELDEALLDGRIDCAVHSMKDVPTDLAPGTVLAAVLERADVRDVLVTRDGRDLRDLEADVVVGTTSLRRQAQCLAARPGARVQLLRGNVETRLRKLAGSDCDATFLAAAGLGRLGFSLADDGQLGLPPGLELPVPVRGRALDPGAFVPAVGQGAIGISARSGDTATIAALADLEDGTARLAVTAERAFARVFGGGCHLPVAAHARVERSKVLLTGLLVSPDGSLLVRDDAEAALQADPGSAESLRRADELGDTLGRSFLERGGREILAMVDALAAAEASA